MLGCFVTVDVITVVREATLGLSFSFLALVLDGFDVTFTDCACLDGPSDSADEEDLD